MNTYVVQTTYWADGNMSLEYSMGRNPQYARAVEYSHDDLEWLLARFAAETTIEATIDPIAEPAANTRSLLATLRHRMPDRHATVNARSRWFPHAGSNARWACLNDALQALAA